MRYLPFNPLFDMRSLWTNEDSWSENEADGLNVYEENNEVVVEAAVPGIKAENIKVTYEDGVLKVTGKTEEKDEEKKKNKIVRQWQRVANFHYSTYLHRPIDSKTLSAESKDGIVTIRAKIAEEAKAREIPVKVSSK